MLNCDPNALATIAIIYFALFFDFFFVEGFVIVSPDLAEIHGWDTDALTPILSICKFTMMLTCPFVAVASTKVAAHTILVVGIAFLALSALGQALSNSFWWFAASKVAHGIASPSLTLSSMSILTYLAEETTRGQYASYGYTAISHGLLLAPFITGLMLDKLGQFWTFIIYFAIIATNLAFAIIHFYEISIFGSKKSVSNEEAVVPKKDVKKFDPISAEQCKSLLGILMRNPMMLTAVTSCFLVGFTVGNNESVFPVLLKDKNNTYGLNGMVGDLVWTGGSIAYMIFAVLSGYFADRMPPVKLVIGGMVGFILTFAFMPQVCTSLVGIISHITLSGALTSFLDVAAYPLIASVVDTADIPNAYIIGYSIEYCLEQMGYAFGQYSGIALFQINDSLQPVGILVAGVDGLLLCFSLFVIFVYPANRFIVESNGESLVKQDEKDVDKAEESTVSMEEGMIHEQE